MRKSFTTRVFILHFLLLALPLLVDAFVLFTRFYTGSIEEARKGLVESATFRSFAIEQLSPVPPSFLNDVSYFMNLSNQLTDKAQVTLDNLLDIDALKNTQFSILEMDRAQNNYRVVASTLAFFKGKTVPDNPFFKAIVKNSSAGNLIFIKPNGLEPNLYFVQGILISSNEIPTGLLLAGSSHIDGLNAILESEQEFEIDFALLDRNGVIMASSIPALRGNYFKALSPEEKKTLEVLHDTQVLNLADKPLQTLPAPKGYSDFQFKQTDYLAYTVDDPTMGISLVAFASKQKYLDSAVKHLIIFSVIFIIVITIGIFLAYFLAHWISRPLKRLIDIMESVERGDLTQRFIPYPFGYEINIIGSLYNETLEALLINMQRAEDEHVKREKYEKEVELSQGVQESLLSKDLPKSDELKTAAVYLHAKEVGGDFYCIEKKDDKHLWIAVGDAAGKGISSCLYSLSIRSLMRTYAQIYDSVEMICAKTNDDFLIDVGDTGMYVTSLMGMYSFETKKLMYYSSGHVPGLVRHRDGTLAELSHSGMALGLLKAEGYHANEIQLQKGDLVLFYTNGLVEGVNRRNQYFSLKRIKELLQHRKWQTAEEAVDGLLSEFMKFTAGVELEDEVVIVALEIL